MTETQEIDLTVLLTEVKEKLAETLLNLQTITSDRDRLRDALSIVQDRLTIVSAAVKAAEHSMEQWRKTAIANGALHDAAHAELQTTKARLKLLDPNNT
jgi:hypothetical protein